LYTEIQFFNIEDHNYEITYMGYHGRDWHINFELLDHSDGFFFKNNAQ
jgi:hypothetical protein